MSLRLLTNQFSREGERFCRWHRVGLPRVAEQSSRCLSWRLPSPAAPLLSGSCYNLPLLISLCNVVSLTFRASGGAAGIYEP